MLRLGFLKFAVHQRCIIFSGALQQIYVYYALQSTQLSLWQCSYSPFPLPTYLRFLPDGSHACGDVVLFVRHGLFFSEVSNSFFSLLDHYSDDVGVSVLVDNFFLIFTLLLFAVRQIIEATHFLTLFSLISEISLSWKT